MMVPSESPIGVLSCSSMVGSQPLDSSYTRTRPSSARAYTKRRASVAWLLSRVIQTQIVWRSIENVL